MCDVPIKGSASSFLISVLHFNHTLHLLVLNSSALWGKNKLYNAHRFAISSNALSFQHGSAPKKLTIPQIMLEMHNYLNITTLIIAAF
jgi:hypothetical protein